MVKGKKNVLTDKILDTPGRKRLQKQIGKEKLSELEAMIVQEASVGEEILETPARKRLREEIGQKELDRIEKRILSGEL